MAISRLLTTDPGPTVRQISTVQQLSTVEQLSTVQHLPTVKQLSTVQQLSTIFTTKQQFYYQLYNNCQTRVVGLYGFIVGPM